MYHTRSERRIAAAQNKDRPELEKHGWDVLNMAKKFKLPPLDDKMVRVDGTKITPDEFRRKYEAPRVPCVITGLTRHWKAHENWTLRNLLKNYGNEYFKCGASPKGRSVHLKFKYFFEYMAEYDDDSPLYIFDGSFDERKGTKKMLLDYEVPEIFQESLFDLLGKDRTRPPHRWITIGPARSGTNIHIDPLGTSAWNALIHGHKRWVFIHPDTPRELVQIPKAQRNVHPKEAITWFSTVYKRILHGDWPFDKYPVYECRQNPGETLFVPCGWWHVVINEDNTVAVTQNFCSSVNLPYVYPTIRKESPSLTRAFLEKLCDLRPDLLSTIYDSLLDPKPIDDAYSSSSEKGYRKNESDDDDCDESCISADSTDVSEESDEEGEDEDKEEQGDSEEDLSEDYENEENSDDEDWENEKGKLELVGRKARSQKLEVDSKGDAILVDDSEEENDICESDDSEESETFSDYDTDYDLDDTDYENNNGEPPTKSPEIHTEPPREISPVRFVPENGVKRRAARDGKRTFLPGHMDARYLDVEDF
ncbi:JmjC domain protein [Ancylostoma duodenale]|uniref:JmjC domain protein n=1 Tax=Ancylostoma duodenale TaxID=51022 RepID=A0A0C2GPL2_9BILA|nr:JmjC domain protein [Ancylostoma duodenale]